jgi:hypothetical protein
MPALLVVLFGIDIRAQSALWRQHQNHVFHLLMLLVSLQVGLDSTILA